MVFVKAWFGDRAAHTCAPRTPFYSGCRWRCLPGFLHGPFTFSARFRGTCWKASLSSGGSLHIKDRRVAHGGAMANRLPPRTVMSLMSAFHPFLPLASRGSSSSKLYVRRMVRTQKAARRCQSARNCRAPPSGAGRSRRPPVRAARSPSSSQRSILHEAVRLVVITIARH